ncbi:succinylglutamate desuccinylase/aspartoacylase family protein [Haladaptatus sp. GCM10025707]|uniref:succinylglutamate desuccinylase/aspartoacylase family protein n=1 Tax=unclassified Haladaptatus TaxID=2622732 RepID=UPI0023E814F0|nr:MULTISPECIES: succinylglutamate desuccinylase/aspartoacylase family protein [unclassified Haladaptatus]
MAEFSNAFHYNGETVEPGEVRTLRHEISETYLGDPVEIPVTIINGRQPGPSVFLTAAIHGDELNGVKVVQEAASTYKPGNLHGTLVCIHVVNIPGYLAQQRYIPIYDLDLNRSFPGKERSNTAERMANNLFSTFIKQCDLGLDFHTSTRNRTTMFHVRADMSDPEVERLARSFGANVILGGGGDGGSLRGAATSAGVPTITIEMGQAHRFQRRLIKRGLQGVESILAEYEMLPDAAIHWPGWTKVIGSDSDKTWLRADVGGLVEMHHGRRELVYEGEVIATITDHFKDEVHDVEAPFTGLLVGLLQNPVAAPGHPLCHLVEVDDRTREVIESEQDRIQRRNAVLEGY